MGFVPFSTSTKTVPVVATSIPTTPLPNIDVDVGFNIFGMDIITFIIIVVIASVLTAATVFIVVVFCYSFVFRKSMIKKTPCDQQISLNPKNKKTTDESEISLIILE